MAKNGFLITIKDLSKVQIGSVQNDIVIHQYGHSGGSHDYWNTDVYVWDESGLTLIEAVHLYHDYLSGYSVPIYNIGDYTGDGRDDLKVIVEVNEYFGCQYDQVAIYSWSGKHPQHRFLDPPDTPTCNMWRGVVGSKSDPPQAVHFLERAMEQWTVETAPSADLLTFLYVRLAMAYASQGLDGEAKRVLENVYQLPDDASYVQLVQNHLEKVKNDDPVTFCYNLDLNREQAKNTEVGQYVYLKHEGDTGVAYWTCPMRELVTSRLQILSFPVADFPVEALATANLTLAFARAVNVDADDDWEWLGILEPDREPHLIILDAVDSQWQPIRIIRLWFRKPIADFRFQLRDVTGDSEPEIIALTTSPDIYGECEADLGYRLAVITLTEKKYVEKEYVEWLCDSPSLEELDATYFDLVKPTWYTLLEYDNISQNLPDYLEVLETEVISQTRPLETVKKLVNLMTYLPENETAVQSTTNELKYLLGLNYELMGAEEWAITAYLDLIEQAQNSPWSWLAWTRLGQGEISMNR